LIVLIGGNGFLGKHIAHLASQRGEDVLVVSRSGVTDMSFAGVRQASIDMFHSGDIDIELKDASSVLYLASASVPASNTEYPDIELPANVQPAMRAAAKLANIGTDARFVYFSSGGTVYGRGHSRPIPETAALAPITPYGLGKAQAEMAVQFFGRVRGLKFAVLRLGNPIGQWQNSTRQGLVGIALRCLMEGKPLQLFGDGQNLRDYFDADDVAELVLKIDSAPEVENGVWNVGSGIGTGEIELLDLMQGLIGRSLDIEKLPPRIVDLRYSVMDAGKAARDFQWSCTKTLRDSLSEIIARSALSSD
jgi:UDP-glucose 4-epimerase